jgi:hypothetical protein
MKISYGFQAKLSAFLWKTKEEKDIDEMDKY